MAQQRPDFIALPSGFSSTATPQESPSLPSPRAQHVAGEVAPAMSPLDVFAMQSRALAKQLDETRVKGRRVSRLPPFAVADGLAKKPTHNRTGSLERERSQEREGRGGSPSNQKGNALDIEEPAFRPKSYYPRLSKIDHTPESQDPPVRSPAKDELFITPMEFAPPVPATDYFGTGRVPSPEPMAPLRQSLESTSRPSYKSKKSFDSMSQKSGLERGMSIESSSSKHSQYSNGRGLIPPNPPYAFKAPSVRSVESDDDNPGMTPTSFTQHRKLSSSSGFSLPQSPAISNIRHHDRSPSGNSDISVNGTRFSRPAFNFSRPMSRNSRPSMDISSRMSSTERYPQIYSEEDVQTPLSMENSGIVAPPEEALDNKDQATSSYTYSKFSLPRGRELQRSSKNRIGDSWFAGDTDLMLQFGEGATTVNTSLPTPPHSLDNDPPTRSSFDSYPIPPPAIPASKVQNRHSLASLNTAHTGNSGSTIKAPSQNTGTGTQAAEMTAEDHLSKGIECHERGSLSESTYHLRLAARQNNPTAMLLYALACRHGWGMRPNQTEGVAWLRKAMDCASIELTHDTTPKPYGASIDVEKARSAQFALSVYELGVSHMNGWGIEQDKSLALRCFEIASSWGDADAMAEAGFCYAQGVGCKKDLKKAARFYRMAEQKGVSMVGNSW